MSKNITPDQIIDALGGTSEVAALCDIKPPSVSEWRKAGIPKAQLKYLRLARPEKFAELDAHAGRQPPTTNNILDTVPEHAAVVVTPGANQ
jgi:hypothetical protein